MYFQIEENHLFGMSVAYLSDDPKKLNYNFHPNDSIVESAGVAELQEGIYEIYGDINKAKEILEQNGFKETKFSL